MTWFWALSLAALAAVGTSLLTPVTVRLALRLRAVDRPGGRKRHDAETPRLGGIAIAGGILISLLAGLALTAWKISPDPGPRELLGFGIALAIIFILGIVDDLRHVGPYTKLLLQILAAVIVVSLGWQFTALRLPLAGRFDLGVLAPVLSILWIVGITNAINLLDGLDGLAAGIVAVISSSLLVLALLQQRPETVLVTSCIAGACVGFLRHNRRPAKIYMGDSGSLTLGFLLATITLRSVKASAAVAILVPILALGLPIFDTVLVAWYRFLRGRRLLDRFASIFRADRKHLHHLLLETHDEHSKVMVTMYVLAIAFCMMALLVAASGSLALGSAFLATEFVAVMMIRRSGLDAEARRVARERLIHLDGLGEQALPGVARDPDADGSLEPGLVDAGPTAE